MNEDNVKEKQFDLDKLSPEEKGMVDRFMERLISIAIQAKPKKE